MAAESSKYTKIITDTAFALFKEKGYEHVSIREICEAANVPRTSFYTCFSDKADILVHSLAGVKSNFLSMMPQFIDAPNDLERIWFLSDSFLQLAVGYGPELCKAIFMLELNGECDLFDILSDFNDWLAQLLANCQKSGIVGVKGDPHELIPIQLNLAKAVWLDWVRSGGAFPLQETVRHDIEIFLDVKSEYRSKNMI